MNIAVIGSGASAFGVLLKLKSLVKKSDLKVTIFSKNLNRMNKVFLENTTLNDEKFNLISNKNLHNRIRQNFGHTFDEIKIENSNNLIYDIPHSGGLSDIWSGAAAVAMDQDLSNWGMGKSLIDPYYKIISDQLSLSGEKNVLENDKNPFNTRPAKFTNSPSIKQHSLVSKLIKKFQTKHTEDDFQIFKSYFFVNTNENQTTSCINCQSCFSGCPRDSFFRPSKVINEWILKKYFSYQNEFVEKVIFKNNQYEILTNNQKKMIYDKVFLCAGALNSAKIIIRSFGYPPNKICLYDIPTKYFPIVSLIPELMPKKNTFGFSTANGNIVLNTNNYYHLLFGQLPKEYFYARFGKNLFSKLLKNIFDTFCMYGTIYGSNRDFLKYNLTEDLKLIFSDKDSLIHINNNLGKAIKSLKRKFLKKGFLILDNFSIDGKSSSHYSSNLFNAFNIKANNLGEFNKNLHICDSSILGTVSSSQPHTFFLMSNSYRLANNNFPEM